MAEAQKLAVRQRTVLGKKVNSLRRQGVLPGVVFGGDGGSIPVETDAHAFVLGYRHWGNTTLLSLDGLDGPEVPALVHGVARDPRTGKVIHVDFTRVSLTEKTRAEVPLRFVGESPVVKNLGAVLVHATERLEVEAFPQDMPHTIDVDISVLAAPEDTIHVRDITLAAENVRIVNEPDELIAKTQPARVEEAAPAAAAPAEGEAEEAEAGGEEDAAAPAGAAKT